MADVRPIDANAFLRFVDEQLMVTKRIERNAMGTEADGTALMDLIRYKVTSEPTLDYAPIVHAHWETTYCDAIQERESWLHMCSNPKCKAESISECEIQVWKYCPNCGAQMDEEVQT